MCAIQMSSAPHPLTMLLLQHGLTSPQVDSKSATTTTTRHRNRHTSPPRLRPVSAGRPVMHTFPACQRIPALELSTWSKTMSLTALALSFFQHPPHTDSPTTTQTSPAPDIQSDPLLGRPGFGAGARHSRRRAASSSSESATESSRRAGRLGGNRSEGGNTGRVHVVLICGLRTLRDVENLKTNQLSLGISDREMRSSRDTVTMSPSTKRPMGPPAAASTPVGQRSERKEASFTGRSCRKLCESL